MRTHYQYLLLRNTFVLLGCMFLESALFGQTRRAFPQGIEIRPGASNPIVILAVGAITTFDFGDEKPISLVCGLREKLGVQESDANFPGNLIHVRPNRELAGKTTNIMVETNRGRVSFFVKTVASPRGAVPGTFHNEIKVSTTPLPALKTGAGLAKFPVPGSLTKVQQAAANEFLTALANMPLATSQKERQQMVKGVRISWLTSTPYQNGSHKLVLFEVENKTKAPLTVERLHAAERPFAMQCSVKEIPPKQKARIAVVLPYELQEVTFVFPTFSAPFTLVKK